MSTVIFISGLEPVLKNDGTVNTSGTVEFYSPGTAFATPKAVYAASDLTTSLGSIITLTSAGTFSCYLDGDYDIKIKDSATALVRSVYNINPIITSTGIDPSLIANSSFENTNLSNWILFEWNSGTTVVDNIDQTHGSYSVKFTSAGVGGGYITSSFFPCSPTDNVFVSFDIKSSNAGVRNIVQVLWYDSTQAYLSSTTLYDDNTTNPIAWTNKTYTTTPPASAVFGAIKLVGCDSSDATTGTTRFDNILVSQDNNNLVHLTGSVAETITGNKTFSGNNINSGTVTMSGKSFYETEGASVASASSCNIWLGDGNTRHITGTTPIVDFATAPQAGVWQKVIFDGALTLTQSANLNLNSGGANIVVAADDIAFIYADTTTQMDVFVIRKSGVAILSTDIQTFLTVGSATPWTKPLGFSSISRVLVELWPGGGSGGRGGTGVTGPGGGGGAYNYGWFKLSDFGNTETATVGAGGAALPANAANAAGNDGTLSSFTITNLSKTLTAYPGLGGSSSPALHGGAGGGSLGAGDSLGNGGAPHGGIAGTTGTARTVAGDGDSGGGGGGAERDGTGLGIEGGHANTGGGGGGGGENSGTAGGPGGNSIMGGGGGSGGATTAGTSIGGGNGGAGASGTNDATAGTKPSGGGGGSKTGASGAGGDGKIRVTVFAN